MIWQKIRDEIGFNETRIVLLNTRQDRLDRAKQLAEMTAKRIGNEIEYVILIGQSCEVVEGLLTSGGIPTGKIINLGWTTPDKVFEAVLAATPNQSSIIAIGNMGGIGAQTVEFFEHRSIQP
jgi:hypothetical protein